MQNTFIESFDGRLRNECLNKHLFANLAAARRIIEAWRIDYNTRQLDKSLAGSHRQSLQLAFATGTTTTDSPSERSHSGASQNAHPVAACGDFPLDPGIPHLLALLGALADATIGNCYLHLCSPK